MYIKTVNIKCHVLAPNLSTHANKTNYYLSIRAVKGEIIQLHYQRNKDKMCLLSHQSSLWPQNVNKLLWNILTTPPSHNRFMALFPGPPGWAGARWELLDFMVQGKINRGRHTDHPAGCHYIQTNQCLPPPSPHIFYRPDAFPAAQPTASKHWRLILSTPKENIICSYSKQTRLTHYYHILTQWTNTTFCA